MAEAILNGYLDSGGGAFCNCGFEWGPTPAMVNTTPTQSRTTGQFFSQLITGLTPATDYYFRAFATNAAGTTYGTRLSFKTASGASPASVVTLPATNITEERARLNGQVANDAGLAGTVKFQWGQTAAYGMETPGLSGYVTGATFLADIGPLAEGEAYHFKAVFDNRFGTTYGADMSFSTAVPEGPVTWVTEELLLMEAR